jgi:hypothetical protein
VYVLYNPNGLTQSQISNLKDSIKNIQAATSGIIPRTDKDAIDFWSPELAGQVSQAFIPALEKFDADIARAILIPQLLGATPEVNTGSLARARTVFDVFMFHVEQVKAEVSELITEKVVDLLLMLNFPGEEEAEFKLLPASEDVKVELLDAWTKMVTGQIVHQTPQDERHIREVMKFPEIEDEELEKPLGGEPPEEEPANDEGEEDEEGNVKG